MGTRTVFWHSKWPITVTSQQLQRNWDLTSVLPKGLQSAGVHHCLGQDHTPGLKLARASACNKACIIQKTGLVGSLCFYVLCTVYQIAYTVLYYVHLHTTLHLPCMWSVGPAPNSNSTASSSALACASCGECFETARSTNAAALHASGAGAHVIVHCALDESHVLF